MSASSLSSRPRPRPSRSHSPPTSSAGPPVGSFTSAAEAKVGNAPNILSITEFRTLALALTLALTEREREPTGKESETEGRCGGGSAEPGLVSDESGRVEIGVDARMSLYEMNESRFCACDGDGGWESCC